jgi:hypothetical protein
MSALATAELLPPQHYRVNRGWAAVSAGMSSLARPSVVTSVQSAEHAGQQPLMFVLLLEHQASRLTDVGGKASLMFRVAARCSGRLRGTTCQSSARNALDCL